MVGIIICCHEQSLTTYMKIPYSFLPSRAFILSLCFLFASSIPLSAQVVNTEKLRSGQKDEGWFFDGALDFGANRNNAGQTVRLGIRTRLEYLQNRHKYMLLGQTYLTQFLNVNVSGSVPRNFTNRRFAHLRYNYQFNDRLTWEAFTQVQFNQIQLIRLRWLTGTGPRFRLIQNDSSRLYAGAIYMYEYEEEFKATDEPKPTELDIINRDSRLSTYISGAYGWRNILTLEHITYYQPNLSDFADYRISSETTFSVAISEKVTFNTYFQLIYDTRPPDPAVPPTMYSLSTGLGLSL